MAELDPRLAPIMDRLLRTPLAPLAIGALQRLEAAEQPAEDPDEERDPLAPHADETPDDRADRQLRIFDTVIGGRLKLEIDLLDANRDLARQLSRAVGDREFKGLGSVRVISETDPSVAGDAALAVDLLSEARRERLEQTYQTWSQIVQVMRGIILDPRAI